MRLDNCFAGIKVETPEGAPYPSKDDIASVILDKGTQGVYYSEFVPKDVFCDVAARVGGTVVGLIVHGRNKISVEVIGDGEVGEKTRQTISRVMREIGAGSASNAKNTVKYLLEESQGLLNNVCIIVGKSYYREKVNNRMSIKPHSGELFFKPPKDSIIKRTESCEISIVINGVEQSDEQIIDIVGERAIDTIANRASLLPVKNTLIEYNDRVVLYNGIECELPPRGVLVAGLVFEQYNHDGKSITVDEIRSRIRDIYEIKDPDRGIVVLSNDQIYTAFGEINRALREASKSKSRYTKYMENLGYGKGYIFRPKELELKK